MFCDKNQYPDIVLCQHLFNGNILYVWVQLNTPFLNTEIQGKIRPPIDQNGDYRLVAKTTDLDID